MLLIVYVPTGIKLVIVADAADKWMGNTARGVLLHVADEKLIGFRLAGIVGVNEEIVIRRIPMSRVLSQRVYPCAVHRIVGGQENVEIGAVTGKPLDRAIPRV